MNVKQFKDYLSELPDDMAITVSDGQGWLYELVDVYRTITKDSRGNDASVVVIKPIYSLEQVVEE